MTKNIYSRATDKIDRDYVQVLTEFFTYEVQHGFGAKHAKTRVSPEEYAIRETGRVQCIEFLKERLEALDKG